MSLSNERHGVTISRKACDNSNTAPEFQAMVTNLGYMSMLTFQPQDKAVGHLSRLGSGQGYCCLWAGLLSKEG